MAEPKTTNTDITIHDLTGSDDYTIIIPENSEVDVEFSVYSGTDSSDNLDTLVSYDDMLLFVESEWLNP